jgi:hypothetical protein
MTATAPSEQSTPPIEEYGFGTFAADFGVGFAALVVVVYSAMLLGGFSFLTPWLLVTPPLFLVVGFLRGASRGTVWGKGISMSAASLLLFAAGILPVWLLALISSAAGLALRRYRIRRAARDTNEVSNPSSQ